ncbi:MAG: hypothetical protein KC613_20375 [Myxococcales bacterium]|nr:hypothetical protein [Myxococcales bacterium]
MQRRWIIWGFSGWMVACAVNTEPIPGQADQGFMGGSAQDGGAPSEDPDAGSTVGFAACDVDLTCSDDCPDDLDCANADQRTTPPEAAAPSLSEAFQSDDERGLMAGEDAWFTWEPALQARAVRLTDEAGGVPPATLVLYRVEGEDWAAVAHATYDREGVEPLVIELPDGLDQVPAGAAFVLRVHAHEALAGWRFVLGG